MNPSSSGWIKKYGYLLEQVASSHPNFNELYKELLSWGAVFGIHNQIPHFIESEHNLLIDEKAKINVLYALHQVYQISTTSKPQFEDFLEKLLGFYQQLQLVNTSYFGGILSNSDIDKKLEKIIEDRIYIDNNILISSLGKNVLNAYLFQDVLGFKFYLEQPLQALHFCSTIEQQTHLINFKALEFAPSIRKKLSPILASSLTYTKKMNPSIFGWKNGIQEYDPHIRRYFLDWANFCTLLEPLKPEESSAFLIDLGQTLEMDLNSIQVQQEVVETYCNLEKSHLYFLKDSNPAAQLYGKMSQFTEKLILRNSKRLIKELKDSGELLLLLSKSTHKDLSVEEKEKVQEQLLDIFKSIPSLAIFMLPGGAVLLPLFIKLIPKLLPSAFDENRIDEKKKKAK